jgi:hypothetical protein
MKRGSTHPRAPRTRLNRRKLLKGGVAIGGTAGALASPGCAHGPYLDADELPLPDPAVVEGIVASLDRRLAWIDQQSLPPSLIPRPGRPLSPEQQERAARWTTLFRQSVRTLYVTGRFLDLPDEIKIHPDVQERVLAAQPEMNEAVFGVTELLESLGPADHRGIRATLRARPDLGEQLAGLLDEPAREDGIPFKRRMSVRSIALGLTERMAAQSPALTIDPYVRRVRKLEARPPTDEDHERLMIARMGEQKFREHERRLAALSSQWQRQRAQNAAPAAHPPTESPPPARAAQPQPPSRGKRTLSAGGKIMGFGVGSVVLGLVFAGLNALFSTEAFLYPALIFGVTIGPIVLVVGLLVVIVAAIMLAAE